MLKQFSLAIFIPAFLLFVAGTSANISYYGASTFLEPSGQSSTELVITFERPVNNFTFDVVGRINDLSASSMAGPVECVADVRGVSRVFCSMSLTEERKTIQVNFKSEDLVKNLGNRFLFSSDYTLNQNIRLMVVSVKLPEGMALVDDGGGNPGRLTFQQNTTKTSDGRKIAVNWELRDIPAGTPLRFEIFYESLVDPFWKQLRIRYFFAFGVAVAVVLALLIMRRAKKSEELIVSVLDEYERKVMDTIHTAGGIINQRKVVQDLNLSKAKVSRIVKSLAERGVIEVEKRGRTNILKEVKKKFGL